MSRSGGTYRIGTGATSLLMILVILCLTALSVVSYTSAHSELSITRRATKVQEAVYAATAEGYDRLAELDAALYAVDATEEAYTQAAAELGWEAAEDGWQLILPVTEKLALTLRVRLTPGTETRMEIVSFATAPLAAETEEIF